MDDKLQQSVIDILAEWDKLLLNDLPSYRWARISPELCNSSLVYVSKSISHGEHYHDVSVNTVASPNTSFLNSYSITNVSRCRPEHCIRFETFFLGVVTVEWPWPPTIIVNTV